MRKEEMDEAFREAMTQQQLRLMNSPLFNSTHELLMVARWEGGGGGGGVGGLRVNG